MRQVFLPYDFSLQAKRALALVLRGIPFGARVSASALYVFDDALHALAQPGQASTPHTAVRQMFSHDILQAASNARRTVADPSLSIVHGDPVREVLERAHTYDGIVIGGHDHGVEQTSVVDALVGATAKNSTASIYVVRSASPQLLPRRVLCAVDEGNKDVLMRARALCRRCKADHPEVLRLETRDAHNELLHRASLAEVDALVMALPRGSSAHMRSLIEQILHLSRVDVYLVGASRATAR